MTDTQHRPLLSAYVVAEGDNGTGEAQQWARCSCGWVGPPHFGRRAAVKVESDMRNHVESHRGPL